MTTTGGASAASSDREQVAAEHRRCLRDVERRRCDLGHLDRVRRRIRRHEVVLRVAERAEMLERGEAIAPRAERMQDAIVGRSGFRRHVLDGDDAISVRERERRIEEVVDDFERRGADGNRDRHRQTADQRQPAVLDEHAHAEARVERNAIEPIEPARLAPFFLVFLDPAETDVRLTARLFRTEPLDALRRSASICRWKRISSCMSASSCFDRHSTRAIARAPRSRLNPRILKAVPLLSEIGVCRALS